MNRKWKEGRCGVCYSDLVRCSKCGYRCCRSDLRLHYKYGHKVMVKTKDRKETV